MGILFCIIFGAVCAIIASNKGRSGVGWFVIGFFFSLIGLIVILVLPDLKQEQAFKSSVEQENRRLREQLRQEQIKSETFRSHTQRRLDAHDQKLAIDTRADDRVLSGDASPRMLGRGQAPFASAVPSQTTGWYYAIDGQTDGPVPSSLINEMIQNGTVSAGTLVWIEGMADWAPLSRVPEFSAFVNT